nr:MAG TPA: hypothetical protein [Caudoviricetes sp.]
MAGTLVRVEGVRPSAGSTLRSPALRRAAALAISAARPVHTFPCVQGYRAYRLRNAVRPPECRKHTHRKDLSYGLENQQFYGRKNRSRSHRPAVFC